MTINPDTGADTLPGYCPECGQTANIWNDTRGVWECRYCNWKGRFPSQSPVFDFGAKDYANR